MMNALIIFLYVNLILLIPMIFYDNELIYQLIQDFSAELLNKQKNKQINLDN